MTEPYSEVCGLLNLPGWRQTVEVNTFLISATINHSVTFIISATFSSASAPRSNTALKLQQRVQSIETISNFLLLKVLLGWDGLKRLRQILARENSSMSSDSYQTKFLTNLCSLMNFHPPTPQTDLRYFPLPSAYTQNHHPYPTPPIF